MHKPTILTFKSLIKNLNGKTYKILRFCTTWVRIRLKESIRCLLGKQRKVVPFKKTKRVPTKVSKPKQMAYKKQRGTIPSSRFNDENNENFTANGLDYESLEYADYECGDEYTSSQSKI